MRKGSKEVFMICREDTRLVTIGALSMAMTAATPRFIITRNALCRMVLLVWDRKIVKAVVLFYLSSYRVFVLASSQVLYQANGTCAFKSGAYSGQTLW